MVIIVNFVPEIYSILFKYWRCIALHYCIALAYGAVVSMFDFHRSDRGSNPGRGG